MRRLRTGYIVIKTLRYSSWPLLALVLTYVVTGYIMSGQLKLGVDPKTALTIHKSLHIPLLTLFGLHALGGVYLAMRRRRWINW